MDNTNEKWIKETENCSLYEYRLYIFLQSLLFLFHTKLFIYFFTSIPMYLTIYLGYIFLKFPIVKVIIFGFCAHLLMFIFIIKDHELIKNKKEIKEDLIRLKKLKKRKKENLKNHENK